MNNNPEVIIKLDHYNNFLTKEKELKELKNNVRLNDMLKYLDSNPEFKIGLVIKKRFDDEDFIELESNYVHFYDEGSKLFSYEVINRFIALFNTKVWEKYKNIENREKDLTTNAKSYIKSLSFIEKLKLLCK